MKILNAQRMSFVTSVAFHLLILLTIKNSLTKPVAFYNDFNISMLTFERSEVLNEVKNNSEERKAPLNDVIKDNVKEFTNSNQEKKESTSQEYLKKTPDTLYDEQFLHAKGKALQTENHMSKENQEKVVKNVSSNKSDTLSTEDKNVKDANTQKDLINIEKTNYPVSRNIDKLAEYLVLIKSKIENKKEYPIYAKELGLQGTVIIRVDILADGKIDNLMIVKSSGHKSLDKAAVAAVKASGPFNPPLDFGLSNITLDIPIIYKIN